MTESEIAKLNRRSLLRASVYFVCDGQAQLDSTQPGNMIRAAFTKIIL